MYLHSGIRFIENAVETRAHSLYHQPVSICMYVCERLNVCMYMYLLYLSLFPATSISNHTQQLLSLHTLTWCVIHDVIIDPPTDPCLHCEHVNTRTNSIFINLCSIHKINFYIITWQPRQPAHIQRQWKPSLTIYVCSFPGGSSSGNSISGCSSLVTCSPELVLLCAGLASNLSSTYISIYLCSHSFPIFHLSL